MRVSVSRMRFHPPMDVHGGHQRIAAWAASLCRTSGHSKKGGPTLRLNPISGTDRMRKRFRFFPPVTRTPSLRIWPVARPRLVIASRTFVPRRAAVPVRRSCQLKAPRMSPKCSCGLFEELRLSNPSATRVCPPLLAGYRIRWLDRVRAEFNTVRHGTPQSVSTGRLAIGGPGSRSNLGAFRV